VFTPSFLASVAVIGVLCLIVAVVLVFNHTKDH